jgi:plasmid stabilization system protein ParE
MRIIYHPAAEAELIDAARFYEGRLPTLGSQFLDAVEAAVQDIAASPERCRKVAENVRCYLMRRFPYAILYRASSDQIRILAFTHHSRNPGYWMSRLAD